MRLRLLLPLLIVIFVLASVPAALAQEGEGDPDRGGELFAANCAVCHGVDGKGRVGASLDAFPGIEPGPALETIIAEGVTGSVMPAWSADRGGPLSLKDIRDIAAYILGAFDGTKPITPLPTYVAPAIPALPDIGGDPAGGAVVYQANCVMCHGERGEGRFGATLAKAWPSTDPDIYLRQVVHQGIAGTIMPAWAQENGGPLTDTEIADVAAFVLTFEPATIPTPAPEPTPPLSASMTLTLLGLLVGVGLVALVVYYLRAKPE